MPQDAVLAGTHAFPDATTDYTDGLDLSIVGPNSSAWRTGYLSVTIPALSGNTDTAKTTYVRLQVAPFHNDGATWPAEAGAYADSVPVIDCNMVGVASTGSVAKTFKVPLPPGTVGWVRLKMVSPTGISNSGASLTYYWNIGDAE